MKTTSNVRPETTQYLQGKLLVAFNITEKTTEEGDTVYEYDLIKLPENSTDLQVQDAITAYRSANKVTKITPVQARLVMNHQGLRSQVEALINQVDNQDIKDYWEYSLVIERNHPVLNDMTTQLGMTDEQVDALFIEASKL